MSIRPFNHLTHDLVDIDGKAFRAFKWVDNLRFQYMTPTHFRSGQHFLQPDEFDIGHVYHLAHLNPWLHAVFQYYEPGFIPRYISRAIRMKNGTNRSPFDWHNPLPLPHIDHPVQGIVTLPKSLQDHLGLNFFPTFLGRMAEDGVAFDDVFENFFISHTFIKSAYVSTFFSVPLDVINSMPQTFHNEDCNFVINLTYDHRYGICLYYSNGKVRNNFHFIEPSSFLRRANPVHEALASIPLDIPRKIKSRS